MSDIVNPRIESYYLHPKKYAWRSDKELFRTDQSIATPEEENIASVIKERFKMVISSNYTIQNEVEQPTSDRNHISQEAPLDFSVKTVISSPNSHQTNCENAQLESPTAKDINVPNNEAEMYTNSSTKMQVPTSMPNSKSLSSTVPIYNGSSRSLCPTKQRILNNSSPRSYGQPQMCLDNGYAEHALPNNASMTQNDSLQRFKITNHRIEGSPLKHNDEVSFAQNGLVSPRNSPNVSRESSPDDRHYKSSLLHDALARSAGERSQTNWPKPYAQGVTPSSTCPNPTQESMSPPFITTNSGIPSTPITPDSGSVLPNATSALIAGSNPIMPSTYGFFNGLGFPSAAMNPYVNGNILSATSDNRISQTQTAVDKKAGKPVRPFKAITNELLYGIPSMGLPTINPLVPNGGYFRDFVQGNTKETNDIPKSNPLPKRETEASANSAINSSPPRSNNGADLKIDVAGSGDSNCSYADALNSVVENAESTSNNRKRSRTLPDGLKDEAYWERRRKNNQAAKRSRDARRQKEDMVAQQAWLFREQNIQLRYQLSGLEEQHQRLQLQCRAVTEQCRNLELQLRLANEKLSRNRCGKCGSRTDNDEKCCIESNKNN